MNKFSNRLTDCRSRLLDAEAILHHLHNPENLNHLLEECSPEVTLGAMIDKAWELVSEASGDCEAMTESYNQGLGAEIAETANKLIEAGGVINAGPKLEAEAKAEAERTPKPENLKPFSDKLEKIGTASAVISQLMDRILTERTYQDCPDWMESNFTLGGLVQVSEILADCILDVSSRMEQGGQS
ncbi:hypothetical protein [Marinobacter sp. UBA2688]|uniref:hypothetical protein n=1 Tax=Marinobacter sp. UBA2688 TaxID=1946816 RepID=UPI00257D5A46|nr:hypothetical protein [Marinobacter sp. UBA2688]|tara:strand:+ start:4120 stop:4674 length:555 start_codon:yes stop_codon:yes gene_type:complete